MFSVVFCCFLVNVQSFDKEPVASHNQEDDLEEGSINSVASSDDDNQLLQEQSLDMQADMLERLSTAEQARNMELFEQLRAWQAEQREQLILQQQQQLFRLQAEQKEAESRLLVQRQNLWNSPRNVSVSANVSNVPQKLSLRKTQPVGLPQAIATSTLALARLRLQESAVISDDFAGMAAGTDSECPMPSGNKSSSPSAGKQIDVDVENNAARHIPDSVSDSDDVCPLPDYVLDTDSQPKQTGDKFGHEVSANMQSSPRADRDSMHHKCETGMTVSEYDELPIVSGVARGKSFEELILEQLEKERHLPESEQQQHRVQESRKSKCFLRKGEGSARFKTSRTQFPARKSTENSSNLKQSETISQSSRPSGTPPAENSVGQPMIRKSCLKRKTVQNKDSVPKLDFVANNVAHAWTPTTSTPDRKRLQRSSDNAAFHPSEADRGSRSRDSIGDASYLACIQAQAKKEAAEVAELREFELLENYIDDNASFTSNMSTISQILGRHNVDQQCQPSDFQQNTSMKRSSADKEVSVTGVQENGELYQYIDEDSIDFSTDDDGDDDVNVTLIDETSAPVSAENSCTVSTDNAAQPSALQTIYRKVSSMNGKYFTTELQSVGNIRQQLLSFSDNQRSVPVLQSGYVASAADQLSQKSMQVPSQDRRVVDQNSWEQVTEAKTLDNRGIVSDYIFSDDREWNDSVLSSPVCADNDSHCDPQQNSLATVTSSEEQLSAETGYHTADARTDSPPTSKLAQKLFPKLKPQKPRTAEQSNSSQAGVLSSHTGDTTDTAPIVASSSALREKLAQLEVEIQQFRSENAVLATLRKEREQVVDRLKKEMAEFERQKADELRHLEEFKAEETKKLKKERKVFETYQKAVRTGPDKKDREEMETLRSQLTELQDEIKRREQKWVASNQRLRHRVEQLEQENTELREEVRVLEQRRIQDWKPRKNESVRPPAKDDEKLVEPTLATAPSVGLLHGVQTTTDKFQKPVERQQKKVSDGRRGKQLQKTSKSSSSLSCGGDLDMKPSSQTKLSLDLSDETLQQRINAPKPQTISPLTASVDDVRSSSGVRKTAPKSGNVQITDVSDRPYDQVQHPDGKVERVCPDGSREILFTNGTRKQISSDGQTIIVAFFNGDIKQILPDGRVLYYYADAQTTHTTYADGLQIFQFANGQLEKHYIDGTKEIQFPDQTIKYLFPNGSAESVFVDGTVVHVEGNGDKQITFPNGQKEFHTALFKKREYPDGTTKTVFTDGRQETRYSNGRVRVKDATGVVVLDQLA